MDTFEIRPEHHLSIYDVKDIVYHRRKLVLSESAKSKISRCRTFLDDYQAKSEAPVYGINTGFGSLYNTVIDTDNLEKLQENLLMSHACGMGEEVDADVVKMMILLKIQGLSYGHSGVQLETVERLVDFFNHDIIPVVYSLGSLGASGDLAPLSHLCLPLFGMGEVQYQNERYQTGALLKTLGWDPIKLKSKEGLALINGTQFMNAFACYILIHSDELFRGAEKIAAMSLDAFDGRPEPFEDILHSVRNHKGQRDVAGRMRLHLEGSEIIVRKKEHVQDPYSFRCIPQVHGASWDQWEHVRRIVEVEMNSVTDNPIIFPEENKIISGGHFHGQPLAIALDLIAIAIAEIGSISERRTYKLINGLRGLPAFLVSNPGLNSGYMIPQYTAASIVSQNKQLCTPASVDTIDSSNGQEDHVSMGANAATKAYRVLNNLRRILAIELLNAAQAMEFRRPLKSSPSVESLHAQLRLHVAKTEDDRYFSSDLRKVESILQTIL
ncbi:MAG: histidine ammonia-lyase [Flavobacteriales bacterium]|jgi:histidine ammonia-lyase